MCHRFHSKASFHSRPKQTSHQPDLCDLQIPRPPTEPGSPSVTYTGGHSPLTYTAAPAAHQSGKVQQHVNGRLGILKAIVLRSDLRIGT